LQYFRDAKDEAAFLRKNVFLPEATNLLPTKNATYAHRIASLDRFVMFRFAEDATVVPRDSAWFSAQHGAALVPLQQQALYADDMLGLRALDEAGRLVFAECPGAHMQISLDWFSDNVIAPFLSADGGGVGLGGGASPAVGRLSGSADDLLSPAATT
jgi:palmitoyl-protein thioesterase